MVLNVIGCGSSSNTARCRVTPCPAMIELNYFLEILNPTQSWTCCSFHLYLVVCLKGHSRIQPQQRVNNPELCTSTHFFWAHAFQFILGTQHLGGLLDEIDLLFCIKQNSKKCMVWREKNYQILSEKLILFSLNHVTWLAGSMCSVYAT